MRVVRFALLISLLASALVTAQSQAPALSSVTFATSTAVGNTVRMTRVSIKLGNQVVSADEVVLNRDTQEMELSGNVRIRPDRAVNH